MKKVLSLVLVVLMLLMLVSCSSINALLRANISGLPFWVYEPELGIGRTKTAIVAQGKAQSQRQAALMARTHLKDKLSEMLGYELGQEAFREISVLGTLSELSLKVQDEFAVFQDGEYTVYIHAVMDQKKLETATTSETKRKTELVKTIETLVLEGDEFVKTGQEVKAIENYLQAMALGYDLDYIDKEYSFDELYNVVFSLAQTLEMKITSSDSSSARCTISLMRQGRYMADPVASAEILATFNAVDSKDNIYEDSFVYVTDASGSMEFYTINNSITRSGQVVFTLNLNPEIEAIRELEKSERVQALIAVLQSKKVVFDYSRKYALGDLAVSVIEHDKLGYVTGYTQTTDYLVEKYRADMGVANAYYTEFDDEEDVMFGFVQDGRSEACLLVIRVGITSEITSETGNTYVGVEALATLFDARTSKVIYQSDYIFAGSFGENYEEARQGAFMCLADISYSLLKVAYV